MKIKDLVAILLQEDQEREVIMSKDAEGNDFSPLSESSTGTYRAETTWYGETGLEPGTLTDELRAKGYSEDDVIEDGVPALILWPVN